MRSREEVERFLSACDSVRDWTVSKGPCPLEKGSDVGCCAECSFPAGVRWVLGDKPQGNMQQNLISAFKGKADADED